MTGIQKGTLKEQLLHFTYRFNFHTKPEVPYPVPSNWLEALQMLSLYFEQQNLTKRVVLFFRTKQLGTCYLILGIN